MSLNEDRIQGKPSEDEPIVEGEYVDALTTFT